MRPQSASLKGRNGKITTTATTTVSDLMKGQQGMLIRPGTAQNIGFVVGKSLALSENEIEKQKNSLKLSEFEVMKAAMEVKLDATQKRSQYTQLALQTGFEEQQRMINEGHQKSLSVQRKQHDEMVERLMEKHRKEIGILEEENNRKILSLKDKFKEEIERMEKEQQRRDNENKKIQEEQINRKEREIMKLMEDRLIEKQLEMKNQMNIIKSEFERLIKQKDQDIKSLQGENDRVMNEIKELEDHKDILEQRIFQMEKDILKEKNNKDERNGIKDNDTKENMTIDQKGEEQLKILNKQSYIDDLQQLVSTQEIKRDEELVGEDIDLEQLRSDISQSIQFQIEMLQSKSNIVSQQGNNTNSNSNRMEKNSNSNTNPKSQFSSNKLQLTGKNRRSESLGINNNNSSMTFVLSSESESDGLLKVPKNESIGLLSKDIFQNQRQQQQQQQMVIQQNGGIGFNKIDELDECVDMAESHHFDGSYDDSKEKSSLLMVQTTDQHSLQRELQGLQSQNIQLKQECIELQRMLLEQKKVAQQEAEKFEEQIKQLQQDNNRLEGEITAARELRDIDQQKQRVLQENMVEEFKRRQQTLHGIVSRYKQNVQVLLQTVQELQSQLDSEQKLSQVSADIALQINQSKLQGISVSYVDNNIKNNYSNYPQDGKVVDQISKTMKSKESTYQGKELRNSNWNLSNNISNSHSNINSQKKQDNSEKKIKPNQI